MVVGGAGVPALVVGIKAAQVGTERQPSINKRDAPEGVAVRAALAAASLTAASDIFGIAHFPVGAGLKLFRCKHIYFLSGAVPLWPVGLRGVVLFFMILLYMGKPHISIVNSYKSKPHILYNIYGVNHLLFCASLAYNNRCQEDSTKPPDRRPLRRRKDEKMNEYKYSDLRAAALADPTAENLAALGEWLQEYGGRDWNGESWDIENGHRLRPVYGDEPDEFDGFPLLGYEII